MTEKRCTRCGEVKPLRDFGIDRRRRDGRQARCYECTRQRSAKEKEATRLRNWRRYQNDPAFRAAENERSREARAYRKAYLDRLLSEATCAICGRRKDGPGQMHFHHRDPASKVKSISEMMSDSRARFDAELAKCVVLCASCHTAHHNRERKVIA